jgi:hypothetical protein
MTMLKVKNVSAHHCTGLTDFQLDQAARKEM